MCLTMNFSEKPVQNSLSAFSFKCDYREPSVLKINIIGKKCFVTQSNTFQFYNPKSITVPPNTCHTVAFPITIMSSLPAVSVLTSNYHLYNRGLSYNLNISHTNDSYLELPLFNYTQLPITLSAYELLVHCQIVLLGKPYQIYRFP
jgi:hypothetical protein